MLPIWTVHPYVTSTSRPCIRSLCSTRIQPLYPMLPYPVSIPNFTHPISLLSVAPSYPPSVTKLVSLPHVYGACTVSTPCLRCMYPLYPMSAVHAPSLPHVCGACTLSTSGMLCMYPLYPILTHSVSLYIIQLLFFGGGEGRRFFIVSKQKK